MRKLSQKFILIAVMMVLAACATSKPTHRDLANAEYGPYPNDYEKIIKGYLNRRLIDPQSIKDLNISSPQKSWAPTKGGMKYGYLCFVQYNSKNQLGGYAGLKRKVILINHRQVVMFGRESLYLMIHR